MYDLSKERVLNRALREEGRYTPGWVTDTWNLPSGDLKEDFSVKEYPKRNTPIWCSLVDCIIPEGDKTFKCCDCEKREFGIPWLPENYKIWTDKEKEEWKVRIRSRK